MSVVDFDEHKVTTMTIIMPLKGEVDLNKIFPLLEITRIELKPTRRQTKKFKIPFCGLPGAILSARYKGCIRGIIKSTQTRCFLNAITIDISTEEKNVNIKLSKSKIQMCGATSVGLARKAANYVIAKLYGIQDELDYINSHSDEADAVCNWLKLVCKGVGLDQDGNPIQQSWSDFRVENGNQVSEKEPQETDQPQEKEPQPQQKEPDQPQDVQQETAQPQPQQFTFDPSFSYQTQTPSAYELKTIKTIEEIPEHLDQRIALFLIKLSSDFAIYEDYCHQLEWVRSLNKVIEKPLEILDIVKVMVNFNYDLGFFVNRLALAERINGVNGFTALYKNTADHNVTIELPYTVPDGMKIIRRKDRVPCHTFLVYRSGLVTQSGPNEELMRPAYNLFNATINSFRSEISRPGVRKLKYKPSPKGFNISQSSSL